MRFTHGLTAFPFCSFRWIKTNVSPAANAAGRAKWTLLFLRHRIITNVSVAVPASQPVPHKPFTINTDVKNRKRRKQNEKKNFTFRSLSLFSVLGFTACGKAKQSAEELIQQENEIIAEHQDLWDLAFNAVDKDTVGSQTGDYADFLKMALENIKDQLSKEDFKALSEDVKKSGFGRAACRFAAGGQQPHRHPLDSAKSFPAFTGKDFDGNAVDESLFTNNSVTLVNFWFNGCSPCVGELPALQKLHDSCRKRAVPLSASMWKLWMKTRIPLLPQRKL